MYVYLYMRVCIYVTWYMYLYICIHVSCWNEAEGASAGKARWWKKKISNVRWAILDEEVVGKASDCTDAGWTAGGWSGRRRCLGTIERGSVTDLALSPSGSLQSVTIVQRPVKILSEQISAWHLVCRASSRPPSPDYNSGTWTTEGLCCTKTRARFELFVDFRSGTKIGFRQ